MMSKKIITLLILTTLLHNSYTADRVTTEDSFSLGIHHFNLGHYEEALTHFKIAAKRQNGDAEMNIRRIYEFHRFSTDYHEALKWYSLAHEHGKNSAKDSMNRVIEKISRENKIVGNEQGFSYFSLSKYLCNPWRQDYQK